jgi:hypothetical protein
MQDRQLVEKHAREMGLGRIATEWAGLDTPTALTDALLTGSVDVVGWGLPGFSHPEFSYAPAPENVMKIHGFMQRVGTLRTMPGAWQDLFFPDVHGLQGN